MACKVRIVRKRSLPFFGGGGYANLLKANLGREGSLGRASRGSTRAGTSTPRKCAGSDIGWAWKAILKLSCLRCDACSRNRRANGASEKRENVLVGMAQYTSCRATVCHSSRPHASSRMRAATSNQPRAHARRRARARARAVPVRARARSPVHLDACQHSSHSSKRAGARALVRVYAAWPQSDLCVWARRGKLLLRICALTHAGAMPRACASSRSKPVRCARAFQLLRAFMCVSACAA